MENQSFLLFITYKILCLLTGLLFCYFGYKLFTKNIFSPAGDMDASHGSSKINLTKAAPGTFFCVLGALITIATIFKGFDYKSSVPIISESSRSKADTGSVFNVDTVVRSEQRQITGGPVPQQHFQPKAKKPVDTAILPVTLIKTERIKR